MCSVRMGLRQVTCFTLVYVLAFGPVFAQSVKRTGVIDVDSDVLSDADKASVIAFVKDRFAKETYLSLVRDEEIDENLVEKNRLRAQVERLRLDHENRLADLKTQFNEALKFYQASQFEEAIGVLEAAWSSLKTAALVMDTTLPSEILKLLAACHFFMGEESKSKQEFVTLLDLDPESLLSAQRFPPALQELYGKAKAEKRFERKFWTVGSSVQGIRANLLGYPIDFQEGEKTSFKIPLGHPILGDQVLVVEKEGFVPLLISLKSLPTTLNWQPTSDQRQSTKGLFSPVGSLTPPVELKKIIQKLNLDLIFLNHVGRDPSGKWMVKAQLLEQPSGRTTPIVQRVNASLREALTEICNELLSYVSPEGAILTNPQRRAAEAQAQAAEKAQVSAESGEDRPFYKTWWFWTIVGVGVAGAGVGAFLLLKPEDSFKFEVAPGS